MKIPLVFGLAGVLCGAAWAQTVDGDVPITLAPSQIQKRTFQVPIHNVKASVMAYWLDPFSPTNQVKAMSAASATFPHQWMPPRPVGTEGLSKALPSGVDRIVAVDPQNALLVFGTVEGVDQLANTIRALDRPIQQVEVEARFYRIATDEMEKLRVEFRITTPESRMSPIRGNISRALDALQDQKKVVLLTAPRVTTFNTSLAELEYTGSTPVTWGVKAARSRGASRLFSQDNLEKLPAGTALKVVSSQSLQVKPTINGDDTVTLSVDGEQKSELQGSQATDGAIVLERREMPQVLANVRDGETIAIEGPEIGHDASMKTIVLLTARIVRRAEDQN